jgi:hypothetical protein
MDVFEMRTGKFTPLPDNVLAVLTAEQRAAYDEIASATAQLDAANAGVENAIAVNRAAVAALHDAEAIEAKKPKYSRLDATRDAIAQWKEDHR